jgi:RNA polymerase sigma-32 factor
MARTAALPALKAESGLSHYLEEIRRFPMLEPQEEYMLARSWREHGDTDAAHKLVTSHLRLVAKIAMGYRGYGLPISEVVSEGNVGLMQAVKRFEPEKGFRLATYAMWWIKAAIQEYILRSWSLVKMGTTANQKKLFFNLRKAKSKISALEEGDLRPDQVQVIAKRLGVTEQDVGSMNRRLGGDASLNAPIRDDGESGEWQDWLVDDAPSQERILAESEESNNRHKALISALDVLNERERRIFEARRLADDPITLEDLATEFGVSRERVRQIEVRAFEKVQKAVKSRLAAFSQDTDVTRLKALEFADSKRVAETAVVLSVLSGVPVEPIDKLVDEPSGFGLMVLCRSVMLEWNTAKSILAARMDVPPLDYDDLAAQFAELSVASAQKLVHFWAGRQKVAQSFPR